MLSERAASCQCLPRRLCSMAGRSASSLQVWWQPCVEQFQALNRHQPSVAPSATACRKCGLLPVSTTCRPVLCFEPLACVLHVHDYCDSDVFTKD